LFRTYRDVAKILLERDAVRLGIYKQSLKLQFSAVHPDLFKHYRFFSLSQPQDGFYHSIINLCSIFNVGVMSSRDQQNMAKRIKKMLNPTDTNKPLLGNFFSSPLPRPLTLRLVLLPSSILHLRCLPRPLSR
jgi:hypothetical protein